MSAFDTCVLPETGGSIFLVLAGLTMLVIGLAVTRWIRASAGRMSVVLAPLVLIGGLAAVPAAVDPCVPVTTTPAATTAPAATTVPPTTTVPLTTTVPPVTTTEVPVKQNLVLDIDTTLVVPSQSGSVSATDEVLIFELGFFGEVDVQIDWGDGSVDEVDAVGNFEHAYQTAGKYTITLSGSLTGFGQEHSFDNLPLRGAEYLTAVHSFGDLGIESLSSAFTGSINLVDIPASLPATVTDLFGVFMRNPTFNQSVDSWDTSNVTNMSAMFFKASLFNQSLGSWDTSNVTNMRAMFLEAKLFNQSLSNWKTGNVTNMAFMFGITNVFNQSLSNWDTSKVTDMERMFWESQEFNQSLDDWDTSNVTNMNSMFRVARGFNQSVSGWDTSNVTDMRDMFNESSSFNQSLGLWNIGLVAYMAGMLDNSAMSIANYDETLNGWASQVSRQQDVTLGAAGLYFSSLGKVSRNLLTDCGGSYWKIINDSEFAPPPPPPPMPFSFDGFQTVGAQC